MTHPTSDRKRSARAPRAHWITATLLAFQALLAGRRAEARKLFIRELRVSPSCVSVSSEALLALIAQQVPRDVLSRRGLQYEDLPSYLDLANWNPERFDARQSINVTRRLHQLDMRYMLWLELSCLPQGSRGRYMLTGRLTDLDVMDRILACPAGQASSQAGRRVCNVNGTVYDAVSFTSVEVASFDDFTAAVRELLARLLHVPEVGFGTTLRTFDPSEDVDLPFLVRRNDGTESSYSGSPAPVRAYRMREDVLEIPSELFDEVCRDPASRWNQLACRGGFADGRCDPADAVNYEVRALIHREVPAQALATLPAEERGGDRVVFRAPSHTQNYLVRAEAIAEEQGGSVRSNPVFACVRVRARPWYLGVATRVGFELNSLSVGDVYPRAALITPSVGLDVELNRFLFSSRGSLLPTTTAGLILGFSRLSGVYPCPSGDASDCRPSLPTVAQPVGPNHVSTSWTVELRAQLRTELERFGRVAPLFVSELGVGAEHLTSEVNGFRNDGWGALFLAGVGGGLQMTLGRPGHGSTQVWLTAQWQVRARVASRAQAVYLPGDRTWFDAAGVADSTQVLWLSLGASLAPSRND